MQRVLFIGSKSIGLTVVKEMYKLFPDKLVGIITLDDSTDSRTALSDFINFSNENNIKLSIIRRSEFQKVLESYSPDICFVVGWYWLISQEILNSVQYGFIGIHNSLLPKYRGGSPLVWQLINGEKIAGFSIFSFTPGMDDGKIWAQGQIKIDEQDYIQDVIEKMEAKTLEIFPKIYKDILELKINPQDQDHENATYCALRSPADGNIDWKKSATEVVNFIRAQSKPYPGAYTFYDGKEMKIWNARIFKYLYFGTPGQIAFIKNNEAYIICGGNTAIICEKVEYNNQISSPEKVIKSITHRLSNNIQESLYTISI